MEIDRFIVVGENIHCTRIFKVGGKFVRAGGDAGAPAILYTSNGRPCELPVPAGFTEGADWANGKIKHCAAAIWQGCYGEGADRESGRNYLQALARAQAARGAAYLDVNVDEFSSDTAERVRLMQWTIDVVQQAVSIPVSVDSSSMEILQAGLEACDAARGRPMINSVSLERQEALELAARYRAVVIASAAGECGLPSNTEERLANLERLIPQLRAAGLQAEHIHVDPLVFPISVDAANGTGFLSAVKAVRETYGPAIHIVAGLSNVSFGMPNRKLINQVFSWLAVEAGADGGIVDPAQINREKLCALDPSAEDFQLARELLLGADEYGVNYIAASREGRL
jgi:cobalamin-dependent methionine synthase I